MTPQNNPVIALSSRERAELFEATAQKMALPAILIEKDFWVCWTLEQLFRHPEAQDHFIFKGGTSLSKVWKAIERFSEDIDVSLSREWLGFVGERDPANVLKPKIRDRLLKELHKACAEKLKNDVLPRLLSTFRDALGTTGWDLGIDPDDDQCILFTYPSSILRAPNDNYTRQIVRIESGARSDKWPMVKGIIKSYVEEAFPQARSAHPLEIPVLSIERTFWEKATILHAEAHRKESESVRERYSRHYADLVALANTPEGQGALKRDDLLESAVEHKKIFFRAAWNQMDAAIRGTFQLIPSEKHLKELEEDYQKMEAMYFKTPLPWNEVVSNLRILEQKINDSST